MRFEEPQITFGRTQILFGRLLMRFEGPQITFGRTQMPFGRTQIPFERLIMQFEGLLMLFGDSCDGIFSLHEYKITILV
jgi:hypothetical protein